MPLTKLGAGFGVPRRTVCYRPLKATPKVDPRLVEPIKAMIEQKTSSGYRTVAWLPGGWSTLVVVIDCQRKSPHPEQTRNRKTLYSGRCFDMICEANGIEHRLNKRCARPSAALGLALHLVGLA